MNRTKIMDAAAVDLDGNGTYLIIAETQNGARFILAGYGQKDMARAEKMADRVTAEGSINADLWLDHYPRYGSEAYEAQSEEAYMAAQMIRGGHAHEADFADSIRTLL